MNESPKCEILVDKKTPRIEYITQLIFDQILGIPSKVVLSDEYSGGPGLNYGVEGHENLPQLHPSGFLNQTGFDAITLKPGTHEELPTLFPTGSETSILPFDVFSAAFYLITEYHYWGTQIKDNHGRYKEQNSQLLAAGLHDRPVVNLWARQLFEALKVHFPSLEGRPPTFDYDITIDIDNPWKYLNKPLWVRWAASAKDLLKGNLAQFRERRAVFQSKDDPFYTYDEIQRICPPEKTIYFFLIDRKSPQDSRFTYKNPAYQTLIHQLNTEAYSRDAGLHPSYTAFEKPEQLDFEARKIAELLLLPSGISRAHYLRYVYPHSFHRLEKHNYDADYSICPISYVGFRTGFTGSFHYWYDLSQERISTLKLVPAQVMDRSLQQYLKLDPEAALAKIRSVIEQVRQVNGKFVIILHNETFSESGEWKGWKKVIEGMMKTLKKPSNH